MASVTRSSVSQMDALKDYKRYARFHCLFRFYRDREGEIFSLDGRPVLVVSFGSKCMVCRPSSSNPVKQCRIQMGAR